MPRLERIQIDRAGPPTADEFNRLQTAIERALNKIAAGTSTATSTTVVVTSSTGGVGGTFPAVPSVDDGDDRQEPAPPITLQARARLWISTADPSVPNGVNMAALGAGILLQTVAGAVATPGLVTVSTGLTFATPTLTVNLSTGIAGGQSAIGGTAAGENLTLRSTTNGTTGKIRLGNGSTDFYDEPTGDLRLGAGPWIAGANVIQLTRNINNAVHVVSSNTNQGSNASAGFVMSQEATVSALPYGAFSLFSSTYSTVSLRNSLLFDFGLSTGDMIFSNLAASTGGISFTTTASRIERLRVNNGGTIVLSSLGTGLVKATSGLLAIASAADVAAAITWPAGTDVLVSSGTTTAPVGDTNFTFDTTAHELAIGPSGVQSWYNATGTNFERVKASWVASVWTLKSEKGGIGTVRNMTIDAAAATLTLSGIIVIAGGTQTTTIGVSGTTPVMTINGNPGAGFSQQVFVDSSSTVASSASLVWRGFEIWPATLTVTGSTNVTTAEGLNSVWIDTPTINGNGTAKTITNAATVAIHGAPVGASSATITNAYSLWVQSGTIRSDGGITPGGGAACTLANSGGSGPTTAAQFKWIPWNVDGQAGFLAFWK